MYVKCVHIEGFRNYQHATAQLSEGINVIIGHNAHGKTNLLEAVYFLSAGRSFRSVHDKDLISFGGDAAYLKAEIVSGGREQTLEARVYNNRRREYLANGVKIRKLTDLTGRLTTVLFCPDDLDMIKGGAAIRRKMIDQCLSQLRPAYAAALSEFNRLYDHKTRILRDHREKPSLLELLDDFNLRLAEQSARLIHYRSAFTQILSKKAAEIHRDFSSGDETLNIRYNTVGGMDASGKSIEQILATLIEHQNAHRLAELRSGLCLSGAHKDDLEIDIDGVSARRFASQGQSRTAAVSIKLAERDIHFSESGEYPALLLDDVLSELDSQRQAFILGRISTGQVLITCCDESMLSDAHGAAVLRIENGRIL